MDFVVQMLEAIFRQVTGRGLPDHDAGAHRGQRRVRRLPVRGRRDASRRPSTTSPRIGRLSAAGRHGDRNEAQCSAGLEIVLTIAHREASCTASCAPDARAPAVRARARSGRREDPRRVRRRPAAAARELDEYLTKRSSNAARARSKNPSRRWPSAARCRRPCCTCRARARRKCSAGDVLAAMLQETKSFAAQLCRPGRHAARHPELHLARHPQGAGARPTSEATRRPAGGPRGEERGADGRAIRSPRTRST